MYETLLPVQVRIEGEDNEYTIDAMVGMALVLLGLKRFDDAHRIASRGLLLARKVGNDEATADFVELLSCFEQQVFGGGGKGEQKKKSSKPAEGTDEGGAAESGGGKVKACAVCISTVKTKACSGCKQVYYVP
jgi:hypothetical protein